MVIQDLSRTDLRTYIEANPIHAVIIDATRTDPSVTLWCGRTDTFKDVPQDTLQQLYELGLMDAEQTALLERKLIISSNK